MTDRLLRPALLALALAAAPAGKLKCTAEGSATPYMEALQEGKACYHEDAH